MKICLIEPFWAGSHKKWSQELMKFSSHDFDCLTLPGKNWKWRMHGGAVTLANEYNRQNKQYDLILCSDMLDLSVFKSLLKPELAPKKFINYFHENQLGYPWSKRDQQKKKGQDFSYAFKNFTNALIADFNLFNSNYHLESFHQQFEMFLKRMPDFQLDQEVEFIKMKSKVLHLGLDLGSVLIDPCKENHPVFVWNHRWEYDKNPEDFFKVLLELKNSNVDFKLIVLGESYKESPDIFKSIEQTFSDELIHFGYAKNITEYYSLLSRANISFVTSNQDYFGISAIESVFAGSYPLFPNRLAFPEHIPDDLKSFHLYQDTEEACSMLKEIIEKKLYLENYRSLVEKYDWKKMISIYDDLINELFIS